MKSGRRGPRPSFPRAARVAAVGAVLAAAILSFALSASSLASERLIGLIASWQLYPLLSRCLHGAALALTGGAVFALGGAIAIMAAILLLSALLGRWYCSVLCPLGGLQDLASFLGRRKRRYRKPANAARAIAFVFAVSLPLMGAMSIASYLDPWSIFGRFMSDDIRPLIDLLRRRDLHGLDAWGVIVPAVSMAAVLVLAVLRGRWFCGALCPVGSLLGILNRLAPLRVRMDGSACVSCGACSSRCPASCIDVAAKSIDASRCVNCLACIDACPTRAIRYGPAEKNTAAAEMPMSRRRFLASMGGGAAALALAALPGRALASALSPSLPAQQASLPAAIPPGARSRERFLDSCTACGLCAAVCPSKVLQPSLGQLGARGLFVPMLDFSVSYCQYECVSCSQACPSGALERIGLERKKLTKLGTASLVKERCIVVVQGTRCGACAEHCPTGAVHMVPNRRGIPEPFFSADTCIGCGACHHACPVKPEKAISVAGLAVHGLALPPPSADESRHEEGGNGQGGQGDFPF